MLWRACPCDGSAGSRAAPEGCCFTQTVRIVDGNVEPSLIRTRGQSTPSDDEDEEPQDDEQPAFQTQLGPADVTLSVCADAMLTIDLEYTPTYAPGEPGSNRWHAIFASATRASADAVQRSYSLQLGKAPPLLC